MPWPREKTRQRVALLSRTRIPTLQWAKVRSFCMCVNFGWSWPSVGKKLAGCAGPHQTPHSRLGDQGTAAATRRVRYLAQTLGAVTPS